MKLLETNTGREKAEYVSVKWSFSILSKLYQDPVQTQNPGDLGSLWKIAQWFLWIYMNILPLILNNL